MESWREELYLQIAHSAINNLSDSLAHHGILGQKWGVRRFQNPDGSLTEAGKKRVAKQSKEYQNALTKGVVNDIIKYKNTINPSGTWKNAKYASSVSGRNGADKIVEMFETDPKISKIFNESINYSIKEHNNKLTEDERNNAYNKITENYYKIMSLSYDRFRTVDGVDTNKVILSPKLEGTYKYQVGKNDQWVEVNRGSLLDSVLWEIDDAYYTYLDE